MAALIDARDALAGDVDDLTDTTPQPGVADSSTNVCPLAVPKIDWTAFVMAAGSLIDAGGAAAESWGFLG